MSVLKINPLFYPKTSLLMAAVLSVPVLMSGCQSLPAANSKPAASLPSAQSKLQSFNISGKIGVTNPSATDGNQGGSAFYAWGQENERFAIELIGALGIGKTNISYDGQSATLVSEKTGTLSAKTPEELLQKATGWQAPISQMPYWISGRPAPTDKNAKLDAQNRLISSQNGAWSASFSYKGNDKLPNKISAIQPTGQKVVMTITHQ